MALQGYFDDSKNQDVLLLAGYFATPEQWDAFSDEWKKFLRYPPAWPYLKMQEVANLRDDAAWEKLMWMHKRIQEYTSFGVVCAIDIGACVGACRELNYRGPKNFYHHLAMSYLMNDLLDHLETLGIKGSVDLIFDTQIDVMPLTLEAYTMYTESRRRYGAGLIASSPLFKDDKDVMPLQAADFAAWWARKTYIETGDASAEPDFLSRDATRQWKENDDHMTIVIQPNKMQMKEKLSILIERFKTTDLKDHLPKHARKRYPKGTFNDD